MWVLIEGTSFSGLLWANTPKSKSVLCAHSPTRLSSLWLCLQDSSDSVRRTVHFSCCSTFPGSVLCLATTNSVPTVGQRRVTPGAACALSLRWAQGWAVAVAECRGRQGTQQHLCSAGTGSAHLHHPVIDLCRNQPWGGCFTCNTLAKHQNISSAPFASFSFCGTRKIRKRTGWRLLDHFLPWFCSAIKRQGNKLLLSGPSLTQTL